MELVMMIALFAAGWVSARFKRWSDEHIAGIVIALAGAAIAITRGHYAAIFPVADSYSEADNLFLGLTPNQLAAVAINAACFFAGAIARTRKERAALLAGSPARLTATAEVFRKSHFLDVKIANCGDAMIYLVRLVVEAKDKVSTINVACAAAEHVAGNMVTLSGALRPGSSHMVELEFTSLDQLSRIWVHGIDAQSGITWHEEVALIERG